MSHQMCNFASGHPRDMVLISNNRFLGMGNHLGPFSEASDQPEGQELGGGAVGGQEVLQEVKFHFLNVLGLQVDLGLLKVVSLDSPYHKTLVLSPEPCL